MSTYYENFLFDAIDEKGKVYYFDKKPIDNGFELTLKKETLQGIEKIRLLPTLSKAKVGDEGFYITPRNLDMKGDIYTSFIDREDVSYKYNRPILTSYCVKTPSVCALIRVKRISHYYFETDVINGVYTLTPTFIFTENDDKYCQHEELAEDIKLEVIFFDKTASYNDMAKMEREIRLNRDELLTLKEKCLAPAVEYARKYPVIRIRLGWKPSPAIIAHQTIENEPEMHVACTFKRVREIADELKRQGIEGAELQLVGWNKSGHDGRFPQFLPVEPKLGGEEELVKTIEYVKSLGYRISTHTIFTDAYEIADTFTWDDIIIDRKGEYLQVGHYCGGYAYHVCAEKQIKNSRRELPKIKAFGENGLHYIDVISICQPDRCYSKVHPMTTTQGIEAMKVIMKETKELFGGFSSEGCIDYSLKYLDYGLYTSFGEGFKTLDIPTRDYYLPFFEMTFHGTILYNPVSTTVNYKIKQPVDKLDAIMRAGKPTFYFFSKFRTGGEANWMGEVDLTTTTDEDMRFAVSCVKDALEEYKPFADKQFVYIDNYQVLDNGLHVLTYADGSKIIGNYNDFEVDYNGKKIAPYGYVVE